MTITEKKCPEVSTSNQPYSLARGTEITYVQIVRLHSKLRLE